MARKKRNQAMKFFGYNNALLLRNRLFQNPFLVRTQNSVNEFSNQRLLMLLHGYRHQLFHHNLVKTERQMKQYVRLYFPIFG